jgi:hypothetical protein
MIEIGIKRSRSVVRCYCRICRRTCLHSRIPSCREDWACPYYSAKAIITAVRNRGVQGVESLTGFTLQNMILLKIFRESTFCKFPPSEFIKPIFLLHRFLSCRFFTIIVILFYFCEKTVNSLYTLNLSDIIPEVFTIATFVITDLTI